MSRKERTLRHWLSQNLKRSVAVEPDTLGGQPLIINYNASCQLIWLSLSLKCTTAFVVTKSLSRLSSITVIIGSFTLFDSDCNN